MATLDQVFAQESAWIAACDDVDALLDKINDWQDDVREAEAHGRHLVRMRAGDLVELARKRVVRLKAVEIKGERLRSQPATPPTRTEPAPNAVVKEAPRYDDSADKLAKLQAELDASRASQRKAERERAVADALAITQAGEAAAAKRAADEAKNALARQRNAAATTSPARQQGAAPTGATSQRTEPAAAARVRAAPTSAPQNVAAKPALDLRRVQADASAARAASPRVAAAAPISAAAAAPRANPAPTQSDLARAIGDAFVAKLAEKPPPHDLAKSDREALESAGRFPLPGPKNPTGPWRPDDQWPEEWTLTGYDLVVFRRRIQVTQKVLAGQLGVEQGTISKAETALKAKLGPTLQVALRKAISDVNKSPAQPRREGA